MKLMVDIFLKAIYDIQDTLNSKKYLKKIRVSSVIRRLKKDLYKSINTSHFSASNIVNLCLLVDTAQKINLGSTSIESSNIKTIKGAEKSRWPVIGIITINTDNKIFTYQAHMDSDIDLNGEIDIHWEITNGYLDHSIIDYSKTKSYSKSVKEIANGKSLETNGISLYLSYQIISNVFTIYIEDILDRVKGKYLK